MGNEGGSCLGKIALSAGSGCFGTVFGMVVGFLLCVAAIIWIAEPPKGVTASVDAPPQLDAGDKVKFVVNVTNHNENVVKIKAIDIGVNYFDGITLLSVTPDYESYFVPEETTSWEEVQSYYFSLPINPGETVSITFIGNAVVAGDYGGSLDVCIDSDYSCIQKVIRTVVK